MPKYNSNTVRSQEANTKTGGQSEVQRSCALTTKSAGKCKILRLDGDTFCVDGGKVGVLEERDEVCLGGFLEGHDSRGLEAEVRLWSMMSTSAV